MSAFHCPLLFAPFRLSGAVYGALLNDAQELAALGDAAHQPPYKVPPRAPVLQIKPRNTLAADGDTIVVPTGVAALVVGATLGIVIGRVACRVAVAEALDFVAGYTIVNDVCVPPAKPETSHYRPGVAQRARDGFCPISAQVLPARHMRGADADALAVCVRIDGAVAQQCSTGGRIRNIAQLIADVTVFMTLQPGDLLLLGAAANAPLARAGQHVEIEIEGLGCLRNTLVAQT